jgi:hypothetical protein
MIVYAGQLDCYEGGEKVLKKLADVEIGSTQMFRITNTYGAQLLKEQEPERTLPPVKKEDVVYVQTDGSMILTRDKASKSKDENDKLSENQWREVKLCRIFKSSDCLHPEGKPGMIRQSQYFASLGTLRAFIEPLTEIIDSYGFYKRRRYMDTQLEQRCLPQCDMYFGLLPRKRAFRRLCG